MALKIYLAAPADIIAEALTTGLPPAPMAYYLSEKGELFRAKNMPYSKELCPVITCGEMSDSACAEAAESIAEAGCGIAVLEGKSARKVCGMLRKRGIRAFSSEADGTGVPCVMSTAISGGTFEDRVITAIKEHGEIAAEAELARMEFTLPEKSGEGRMLSSVELSELSKKYGKCTFFSEKLMTWYFSYCENGRVRFVLYDNSESMCRKLKALERAGVGTAFLYYPDVKGILPKIRSGL